MNRVTCLAAAALIFAVAGCNPNGLAPSIVVGADAGGTPSVRSINSLTQITTTSFSAFDASFSGGVRVAVGDVNGDGVADIIAGAGPGGPPQVRVFSGKDQSVLMSFFAFDANFHGGVFVAAGDINGDGHADIIVGADSGTSPQVRVFDGATGQMTQSFLAFDPGFTGGVRVAAGDVNGDGTTDIIAGTGPGSGPQVRVLDGKDLSTLRTFFAFDAAFTGGIYVAAGDVNGDGAADIAIGAGAGGAPQVRVFDGAKGEVLAAFLAFDPDTPGGVRVAAGDVNGDGLADIITAAGPGNSPHVRIFDVSTSTQLADFFAFDSTFTGGVFVAFMPVPPSSTNGLDITGLGAFGGLFNRSF